MSSFRLTIDSSLTDLFVISLVVRGVCTRMGMDAADVETVDLCTVEAVTNAIKHAYLGERGHEVSIDVSYNEGRLDLYVWDVGRRMPEEQVARLHDGSHVLEFDPVDLGAVPEGGMGLQIIHQLMDEAAYSTTGGSNCLRLTKFARNRGPREVGT